MFLTLGRPCEWLATENWDLAQCLALQDRPLPPTGGWWIWSSGARGRRIVVGRKRERGRKPNLIPSTRTISAFRES